MLIGGGVRMSPKDCFDEAKKNIEIKYVGLQYGGECWGGSKFGKYGNVDDSECSMVCVEDPQFKCGSDWRNSVYDITNYQTDPCSMEPKDCS